MNVTHETKYEDGSGWTALVNVKGLVMRASYVAGVVNTGLAPYKHAPRVPRWVGPYVQKWAEARVASFSPEWHRLHNELYELPPAAPVETVS